MSSVFSEFPYEMEEKCSRCGTRFGNHTGSKPYWWCPGHHPPDGFDRKRSDPKYPYFVPSEDLGRFPIWPSAEEVYEALRTSDG